MPSQEVCAANTVTQYQGNKACVSSCTFIPKVEHNMMICAIDDDADLANVKLGPGSTVNGDFGKLYTWCSVVHTSLLFWMRVCLSTSFPDKWCLTIQHRCDCSCDDLQPVERPSPIIMVGVYNLDSFLSLCLDLNKFKLQSLSFAAQSFVVILVGANLGQFSSFSQPMINWFESRLSTKVLLKSISIFGANISRKMAFLYSQNQNRHMCNKYLQESRL